MKFQKWNIGAPDEQDIALSVIEEQTDEADSHAYVHSLKKDQEFNLRFQQDLKRYALPNEE